MLRWPFTRRRTNAAPTLDPQTAYALWAPTYPPRAHNALMALEQQAVLSLLPDLSGLTVLDIGCGSGRYLRELRDRGARPMGFDLSAPMLAKARQITTRIARADLYALPVDSMAIDVIVCGLALGDVANLEVALVEMARALRPGGCVVYSVVHPLGGPEGWERTFEAQGRWLAIDGFWHTLDDHRHACAAAGLTITAWVEPELSESGPPVALVVRASNHRRIGVEPPSNRPRTIA